MNATVSDVVDGLYVLLTAAYNEEDYIEETIRSVISQVVRPSLWVIVSDGSTDRTDEIVQQYAMTHSFIRLVPREKDHCRGFASKVFALRAGLQMLTLDTTRFIGHLDADVSLEPFYFRDLLAKFREDRDLGIGGGWCFEKTRSGSWQARAGSSTRSVPGGMQMFRRECYEDIGELLPIEYGGEDWYAEIRARMYGWRVRSFSELQVHHLRATGTKGSLLRYCYQEGLMDCALGSHPIFELAKVLKRSVNRPYLVGALMRMIGFIVAHIFGRRMVPPDCVAFLRKEQLGRLWSTSRVLSRAVGKSRTEFDVNRFCPKDESPRAVAGARLMTAPPGILGLPSASERGSGSKNDSAG